MITKSKVFLKNLVIVGLILSPLMQAGAKDLNPTPKAHFNTNAEKDMINSPRKQAKTTVNSQNIFKRIGNKYKEYNSSQMYDLRLNLDILRNDFRALKAPLHEALIEDTGDVLKAFEQTPIGKIAILGLAATTLGLGIANKDSIRDRLSAMQHSTQVKIDNLIDNTIDTALKIRTKREAKKLEKIQSNINESTRNLSNQVQKNKISKENAEEMSQAITAKEVINIYCN